MAALRALVLAAVALLVLACGADRPAFHGADLAGADFGTRLELTDHTGKPRALGDFRGKVVVIFFGYTQCPDVCPTNMIAMAEAMRQLGDDAGKVQILFVSVDPERDTPALLAQYVPSFHPSFLGLYGNVEQTAAAAKEFRVFFQKQPGSTPTTYTIDHSAGSYVIDPSGKLRLYLKHGESAANVAEDLRRLIAGG